MGIRTSLVKFLENANDKFFSKKIKVLHFAPEAAFLEKFKKLKNISYDTIDLNSPLACLLYTSPSPRDY